MTRQCGYPQKACEGVIGQWQLYHNTHDKIPKLIRFKYPNEDWQEIEGDRFTSIQSQGGQETGVSYKVTTRLTNTWRRRQHPYDLIVSRTATYLKRNIPGKIISGSGNISFLSIADGYSWFGFHLGLISTRNASNQIVNYNAGSTTSDCHNSQGLKMAIIEGIYKNPAANTITGNWLSTSNTQCDARCDSVQILNIEREDNQTDPTKSCTFTIFNANNQIIFSRTANICPLTETKSMVCTLKPENEVNQSFLNNQRKGYLEIVKYQAGNQKCIQGNVWTAVGASKTSLVQPLLLFAVCSPEGCDYPKFCWDCGEDCPPETCLRCEHPSHICCYGKDGKVIKVIKKF